jgi:hypothetical protein
MPIGYVQIYSVEVNTASIHMPRVIRRPPDLITFYQLQKYSSPPASKSNLQLNRASRRLLIVILLIHKLLQVPSLRFVLPAGLPLWVKARTSDILLQLVCSKAVPLRPEVLLQSSLRRELSSGLAVCD